MSLNRKENCFDENEINSIIIQLSSPEEKNTSCLKNIINKLSVMEDKNTLNTEVINHVEIKIDEKGENITTENTLNNNDDLLNNFGASKIIRSNGRENSFFLGHRKEEKLKRILDSEITIKFISENTQLEKLDYDKLNK